MKILISLALCAAALLAKVDINNASAEELSKGLTGVGKITSEAIIEYRKAHCFTKAEELTKVKGIGQKTLEKNLENIEIGPCNK